MMTKVLVAGLDDPPKGKLRQVILNAVPKTYVTFFMSSKNALGMLNVVDLVICCHPEVLRLIGGDRVPTEKGWWNTDFECWFYNTNRYTLYEDMQGFEGILRLMESFRGESQKTS